MRTCTSRNSYGMWTVLLFIISLFPAEIIAGWNHPGDNFSEELVVGGQITDNRNPWSWKLAGADSEINLTVSSQKGKQGELIWKGFLDDSALILGKTNPNVSYGKNGLAPEVTFEGEGEGFRLRWLEQGEAEVQLPVYDAVYPNQSVGQLTFRLVSAAMTKYIHNNRPVYVSMYNDLAGNGLPPREMAFKTGMASNVLCDLFAGEGPEWLCSGGRVDSGIEPLSRLTDANFIRPETVYGVRLKSGSGVLKIYGQVLSSPWKATLSVSINYR